MIIEGVTKIYFPFFTKVNSQNVEQLINAPFDNDQFGSTAINGDFMYIAGEYLGKIYKKGKGVVEDYTQSFFWYKKAAEKGNSNAQFNIGEMYEFGKGVDEDYKQAVIWYKKAAEKGVTRAQMNLALMFKNGMGVMKDFSQAVYWYKKAAEQGDTLAQLNLSKMYASGEGVPENFILAYKWANLAAARRIDNAENLKKEIRKRMTPTQIAEAQKLSLEWEKKLKGAD